MILSNDDNDNKVESNLRQQTVGAISRQLLLNKDTKQGIVDTQREVDKTYFEECHKCVSRKPHCDWKQPWYLVVIYKKERLLENVVRRYFFGRQSLPTPEYDQTVWRYYPQSGDMQYVWTIPDKNTTLWMYSNPNDIPNEQQHLKNFVIDFIEDRLYSSNLNKFKD
ncbi:MAG: hypothetical protein PHH73_06360 [Candidatus Rickettsiella isopodorum]|nr:hypothetical protein [Candidatus Rickettsiella isopodorum]